MDGENLYSISVEDVQLYAVEKLGRRLTSEELRSVEKGIRHGLNVGFDVILDTAIEEAVNFSGFRF